MTWYWQWLLFLLVASGMGYALFVRLPVFLQARAGQNEGAAEATFEVTEAIDEEEPAQTCPSCHQEMDKSSINGITVDRCPLHGLWFDKGEFEAVVTFVQSGGRIDGFLT